MQDDLLAKLTGIFRDVLGNDALVLTAATTAQDVEGWDSLMHIRLMLAVQRAFKVRLSAADTSQLSNVGALMTLVSAKLGH